jgi:hypothetical protein
MGSTEIYDGYNLLEESRIYAEVSGYPGVALRSKEDVLAMRDARLKQKQAQDKLAMVTEGVKAVGGGQGMKAMSEAMQPEESTA